MCSITTSVVFPIPFGLSIAACSTIGALLGQGGSGVKSARTTAALALALIVLVSGCMSCGILLLRHLIPTVSCRIVVLNTNTLW
jgi:hypothetical protein